MCWALRSICSPFFSFFVFFCLCISFGLPLYFSSLTICTPESFLFFAPNTLPYRPCLCVATSHMKYQASKTNAFRVFHFFHLAWAPNFFSISLGSRLLAAVTAEYWPQLMSRLSRGRRDREWKISCFWLSFPMQQCLCVCVGLCGWRLKLAVTFHAARGLLVATRAYFCVQSSIVQRDIRIWRTIMVSAEIRVILTIKNTGEYGRKCIRVALNKKTAHLVTILLYPPFGHHRLNACATNQ